MTAIERPWWPAFARLRALAQEDSVWFPEPGITDQQVQEVESLFAELEAPLPPGLLDLYTETAEFGCVKAMDDFFAPIPIDDDMVNLAVRNDEIWQETGVFRVADIGSAALSCNRDGKWSVSRFDELDPPADFTMEFDEAMTAFLKIMNREYAAKHRGGS